MEEKENVNGKKKKLVYYLILGICALLLIAGLVLTVYFVTENNRAVVEKPPVDQEDPGNKDPQGPGNKDPEGPGNPDDPAGPSDPTGGEAERFVFPVDCEDFDVSYSEIYENKSVGWWYRHQAVDFAAAAGTEVRSMAEGTVLSVSISEETGNLIAIDHGDGLKTFYRFVDPVEGLKAGDKVTKGQKIGEVAAAYGSEAFQGEHLHFEVMLNEEYADPADYLKPVLEEK